MLELIDLLFIHILVLSKLQGFILHLCVNRSDYSHSTESNYSFVLGYPGMHSSSELVTARLAL